MPAFFPNNDEASAFADALRTKAKICNVLYQAASPKPAAPYPEGCQPMAGDSEQRLDDKIRRLRGL